MKRNPLWKHKSKSPLIVLSVRRLWPNGSLAMSKGLPANLQNRDSSSKRPSVSVVVFFASSRRVSVSLVSVLCVVSVLRCCGILCFSRSVSVVVFFASLVVAVLWYSLLLSSCLSSYHLAIVSSHYLFYSLFTHPCYSFVVTIPSP
jgi:K+-sensing histidine kinase KdpD